MKNKKSNSISKSETSEAKVNATPENTSETANSEGENSTVANAASESTSQAATSESTPVKANGANTTPEAEANSVEASDKNAAPSESTPEAATPEEKGEGEKTNERNGKKPFVANTGNGYSTDVNDPDLLIGKYTPKEGEPKTIKCPHCGEEMPATIDTCVCCGHYLKEGQKQSYRPMDEKKAKRIRWILGAILLVGFLIWFILKKSA